MNGYLEGYSNFYTSTINTVDYNKKSVYSPKARYRSSNNFVSRYESLVGKYLKIIDVIDKFDISNDENPNDKGVYLKLKTKDSEDVFYYQLIHSSKLNSYISGHENEVNLGENLFILGYYEKLKSSMINKIFIASNLSCNFDNKRLCELVNINTGSVFYANKGSRWTCVDLTFIETENEFKVPIYIFKDSLANEIIVSFKTWVSNSPQLKYFESLEIFQAKKMKQEEEKKIIEENRINAIKVRENKYKLDSIERKRSENNRKELLVKKYGHEKAKLILEGKVYIGMTKDMCIEAWGTPNDINSTTTINGTKEQWVYENNSYLYFENNILVAIQN